MARSSTSLWGLKEPSYIMKMMATGEPLAVNDNCKLQKRYWTEGGVNWFKETRLPLRYHWLYKYRQHDHNILRHLLPLIEGTITTTCLEVHVFSFIITVSLVNAFLVYHFFCHPVPTPTLQIFSHKLMWQLIKNIWIVMEDVNEQNTVATVH